MNFCLIESGINTTPILSICEGSSRWGDITARQEVPGSPHHDTQSIYLRGPHAMTMEDYTGNIGAIEYPAMDQFGAAVVQILLPILRDLGVTEMGYMMLVNLQAGGSIDPHIDEGVYADHYSRFHLVIMGESSSLTVNDEVQQMTPGELWWFNHKRLHSARNDSKYPRIHLIFDVVCDRFKVGA